MTDLGHPHIEEDQPSTPPDSIFKLWIARRVVGPEIERAFIDINALNNDPRVEIRDPHDDMYGPILHLLGQREVDRALRSIRGLPFIACESVVQIIRTQVPELDKERRGIRIGKIDFFTNRNGEKFVNLVPAAEDALELIGERAEIRAAVGIVIQEATGEALAYTWSRRELNITLAYVPPRLPPTILRDTVTLVEQLAPPEVDLSAADWPGKETNGSG